MPINAEVKKIRAKVISSFGTVETPYVLSFYVSKNRNQLDSFSCSLKIKGSGGGGDTGDTVEIKAGVGSPTDTVFKGYVTSVKVRPCFEDPSYVIIDLSGTDARKFLEGRKVTRRQRMEKKCWAEITGVNRRELRSSKLKYTRRSEFQESAFPAPADQPSSQLSNEKEHSFDVLDNISSKGEHGGPNGAIEFTVEYGSGE